MQRILASLLFLVASLLAAPVASARMLTLPDVTADVAFGTAAPTHYSALGYRGQLHDRTGLIFLRNRYYDPTIGGFTQPDPIRSGTHWFAYPTDPVNQWDPMGLQDPAYADPVDTLIFDVIPGTTLPDINRMAWTSKYRLAYLGREGVLAGEDVPLEVRMQFSHGPIFGGQSLYMMNPTAAGVVHNLPMLLPTAVIAGEAAAGCALLAVPEPTWLTKAGAALCFADVVSRSALTLTAGEKTGFRWFCENALGHSEAESARAELFKDLGMLPMLLATPSIVKGSARVPEPPALIRRPVSTSSNLQARFAAQGFTAEQAQYLAKSYEGMGHHFFKRKWNLPELITESRLSVLKPQGISRGEFYELHYRVDPTFYGTRFPPGIGGTWTGADLGLTKYRLMCRVWYGSPTPLKVAAGGAAGTVTAATLWYSCSE